MLTGFMTRGGYALLFCGLLTSCDLALGLGDFQGGALGSGGSGGQIAAGGQGGAGGGGQDGGSGGMPPADCWDLPPDSWTLTQFDMKELAGVGPIKGEPVLSPDGLTLYYLAHNAQDVFVPFMATRASRAELFRGGQQLPSTSVKLDHGRFVVVPEFEVLLSYQAESPPGGWTVRRSTFLNGAYQETTEASTLNAPGIDTTIGSISGDGLRLTMTRTITDATPLGFTFTLFEAQRPALGMPFETPSEIQLPNSVETDHELCPAISPDGLHLFFAGTGGVVLTDLSSLPDNALPIQYAHRASRTEPWQPAVRQTSLDGGSLENCPRAVTSDGCEMWLNRWNFGGLQSAETGIYIATRTPQAP